MKTTNHKVSSSVPDEHNWEEMTYNFNQKSSLQKAGYTIDFSKGYIALAEQTNGNNGIENRYIYCLELDYQVLQKLFGLDVRQVAKVPERLKSSRAYKDHVAISRPNFVADYLIVRAFHEAGEELTQVHPQLRKKSLNLAYSSSYDVKQPYQCNFLFASLGPSTLGLDETKDELLFGIFSKQDADEFHAANRATIDVLKAQFKKILQAHYKLD